MKIAIVGYGKMGKEIEEVAKERNLKVVSRIDPMAPNADFKEINEKSLKDVDVAIDFTVPETAINNIKKYANAGVNVVFGTTGWYEHMDEVKKILSTSDIGFIWSGNFSIGVNAFFRIIRDACKVMEKVPQYDPFVYEIHHNQKKDSPSGTAEMIGKVMLDNLSRKKRIVRDKLDRKIAEDELHVASIRGGTVPGTHVVAFDSPFDTIELKHTVRTRKGLALGAVMAAEWIVDKKGFFNIDDFLTSLFE
jgi:4-hydroxy-tetrahydrodipicolinate reductase